MNECILLLWNAKKRKRNYKEPIFRWTENKEITLRLMIFCIGHHPTQILPRRLFYAIIEDIVLLALVFKIGNWYCSNDQRIDLQNNPKSILSITIYRFLISREPRITIIYIVIDVFMDCVHFISFSLRFHGHGHFYKSLMRSLLLCFISNKTLWIYNNSIK